ncbi:efflux RND transporter permease subunit [Metapseudomonas lalkuanensis]|uniref:Efflux RND transporter permease subunit n=1 Tax=Metapseudomonas lalkuanensis TaxID=2604832 RepID=A0A5J6QPR0_9GAMM|nr:efflux RND transporter permease subunit [Pseudomonas lalkuanensis]
MTGQAGWYRYSMFMVALISLSASWVVAVLFSPLLGTLILPESLPNHGHGGGRGLRGAARRHCPGRHDRPQRDHPDRKGRHQCRRGPA